MRFTFDKDTDWREGLVLLFDKPLDWTSFNLVSKVRSLLYHRLGYKKIKVGHAGTLDPLATGLLIVCVGRATKQVSLIQDLEKEYVAEIRIGATTPSFDLETQIDHEFPIDHIDEDKLKTALQGFIGNQMQIPPLFSAKFVNGGRAYKLARKGVDMQLDPSPIVIHDIELISYDLPNIIVRVRCSKGTYIRALARDIGLALSSGAHLVGLKRTAIGEMKIENAMTLENFEKIIEGL
ncbi:MAG: tRNA pseudouridine(55) synthase TruB [Bacteroidales bacterium]|jgi:tRNA pseudouridine55 synthase|nr:tRNA pseudouridine(55) synthase TruB [Bacteroidales bacterium]MDD4384173.1 tRNA pseudouridine(55) synthase TruB [Bacteroidales bacterium]MDY0197799.1 tRNA pseudouridine(55) synthase TruB [Tenuifilaceae bacterium]